MEKVISQEERIRRAEEICARRYNDRQNRYISKERSKTQENNGNKVNIKAKMIKKMLIQILVCILLYSGVLIIQNSNYIFSENFINKTKEILEYDMGIENLSNLAKSCFDATKEKINFITNQEVQNQEVQNQDSTNQENEASENVNEQSMENTQENEIENQVDESQEAIGGAEEPPVIAEEKTQTELDIEFVKNNYSIIWPLGGTITSHFGPRTPTDIVTANHYGLDIGGNIGDVITAAMDGVVTYVSSEGDYGNHMKIENGTVTTLYAHCNKLYLEEGTEVKQGDKIAEVGATGRVTGPHLHFEIRVEDRKIDPEMILAQR